jgi:hypothetical protein
MFMERDCAEDATVDMRYQLSDHLEPVFVELDGIAGVRSREEFSPFGSTTLFLPDESEG